MKNNASLSVSEMQWIRLLDEEGTIDLFGLDYLEDFGVVVPAELVERYKRVSKEFAEVQRLLEQINELKYK